MRALLNQDCNDMLKWEKIEQDGVQGKHTYRTPVPGGWLVRLVNSAAHPQSCDHLFLPDAKHVWGSQDEKPGI
jgi:hypothetical protein